MRARFEKEAIRRKESKPITKQKSSDEMGKIIARVKDIFSGGVG